mmetsp:Transcript_90032/g.238227  ORF Transcript_90032/g.238227 Transcript_90032/m.238227 type:complete len:399 (-) Transcript_90032:521-1717(-)
MAALALPANQWLPTVGEDKTVAFALPLDEPAVRAVDEQHPVGPHGQVAGDVERVALGDYHDAILHEKASVAGGRVRRESSQEGVRVPLGLVGGELQTEVNLEPLRQPRPALHHSRCQGPPQLQHLLVLKKARIDLPEVPEEGAHSEREEHHLLDLQLGADGDDVVHDVSHGLDVLPPVKDLHGLALELLKITEVWGVHRLADVHGGSVGNPKVKFLALQEAPLPVEVCASLHAAHVVTAEEIQVACARRALLEPRLVGLAEQVRCPHRRGHVLGLAGGLPEELQPQFFPHLLPRVQPDLPPVALVAGPGGVAGPLVVPLHSGHANVLIAEDVWPEEDEGVLQRNLQRVVVRGGRWRGRALGRRRRRGVAAAGRGLHLRGRLHRRAQPDSVIDRAAVEP